MGLKPSKPTAPDPVATADTQNQYNLSSARQTQNLNAVDKTNPFGTASYTRDANGNVTGVNQSLTPDLAATAGTIGNKAAALAGTLPTSAFSSTAAAPNTDNIAQTMYNKGVNLMQPQWDQSRNAQDVQLTNRGLPIGSEARNIAEGNLARQHDLALSDLASQSTLAASNEQQRLINNARSDYQMPAQQLSAQLSNLGLLNGLAPQANLPQVDVRAPNYAGLSENAYNQAMQQYNSDMSGLGNIAKMGVGLAAAPFTGGASLGLIGGMTPSGGQAAYNNFTGMFNGSPSYASNGMFNLNNMTGVSP